MAGEEQRISFERGECEDTSCLRDKKKKKCNQLIDLISQWAVNIFGIEKIEGINWKAMNSWPESRMFEILEGILNW